jgi:hypothetical protein
VDLDVSREFIEELLQYFASYALGLSLDGRIRDPRELPASHQNSLIDSEGERPWVAWRTDRGPMSACADYDYARSRRINAHVLQIAWWIAAHEHHAGWWHCYPERPREWIKGAGTRHGPV